MRGKNLCMISGWAHDTEILSPLASRFISSCDVIRTSPAQLIQKYTPDTTPGIAASPYAQSLHSFIESFQEPCTVIAWSMGAVIALEALTHQKMNIDNLIIISGTARFCSTEGYSHGVPVQNLRAMKRGIVKQPEQTLRNFFIDALFPEKETDETITKRVEQACASRRETLAHGLQYLQDTDLRELLATITIPVLILHGDKDAIIPKSAGEFLYTRVPNSFMCIIPDAGHAMLATHSEALAEKCVRFFQEVIPSS